MAAQSRRGVADEHHGFRVQRWSSQSFSASARDFQPSQRPFLYQCPLELGDCHEHPKLKLPDGILLGGIDPLARANQGDVSQLEFSDDDSEVRQAAAQAVEFVLNDLVHATGTDVNQQVFQAWASRCRS